MQFENIHAVRELEQTVLQMAHLRLLLHPDRDRRRGRYTQELAHRRTRGEASDDLSSSKLIETGFYQR